jgi:Gluconate 2-dehydrogenase subunit 3
MAGQSLERREMLRILAIAAAASSFTGFERWAFACPHNSAEAAPAKASRYAPQFFTPTEYATLKRLTEMIIPSDDRPGAGEAGVSEFIDFMVASDPSIQYRFRFGLAWLDARSVGRFGNPFRELSVAQQTEMLDALAYKSKFRQDEEEGQQFFKLLREHTVMGYYTSKVGLEAIDYPGLQVIYASSPACPHHGDPEHRHLAPSAVG